MLILAIHQTPSLTQAKYEKVVRRLTGKSRIESPSIAALATDSSIKGLGLVPSQRRPGAAEVVGVSRARRSHRMRDH
jgi:hypothetical protein